MDPLTGVRNANRLKMDASSLVRHNPDQVFAIWYADIKNFKFYNEMFGYEMGDRELVRIAGLLAACDGPLSLCCRVSADKFAGIRPMSDREEFSQEFQRLCKRIENDAARFHAPSPWCCMWGVSRHGYGRKRRALFHGHAQPRQYRPARGQGRTFRHVCVLLRGHARPGPAPAGY